jgi:predicted adenylyl cyclase CyaB
MRRTSGNEIEVKLALASRGDGLRRLRAIGARERRRVFERNVVFDTPPGRLRKRGVLLRLREERPPGGGRPRFVLTLKGRTVADRRYRVRPEAEFGVVDPAALTAVLAEAGLRPVFRYEKVRRSYRLPGAAGLHIELDEVPFGVFFELEGSRKQIDRVARRLGFSSHLYITKSYGALHAEDCRRRGVPFCDMLFPRK